MNAAVCEWCGDPLTGRQELYCDPIHGLKAWRFKNNVPHGLSGVEQPPPGSPLLQARTSAQGALESDLKASRVSTSGLQVAVGRMLVSLQGPPAYLSEWSARAHVAGALSDRQRQRFEA